MTSRSACLLAGLLLSCTTASSLEAVSATGDGIVFAYTGDETIEATRQASLYCANLGLLVRLRDIVKDPAGRRVATFECRTPTDSSSSPITPERRS